MSQRDRITNIVPRGNSPGVVRKGVRVRVFSDVYHRLIRRSWPFLVGAIVAVYVVANCLFAALYDVFGGVANARSFRDDFFFSIHTMSTVGYGTMAPTTLAANVIVVAEIITGVLLLAMTTGLLFAKFSRPTARVLFSKVAVVSDYDGVPSLMFRMANERTNQIVEAQLRVILLRNERTREGDIMRRMTNLRLLRDQSSVFALTWTAICPLDEASPIRGLTRETLVDSEAEIVVSLVGYDETFGQTIHARYSYVADEVRFGERFVDILSRLPDGRRQIDYTVFHETKAA